MGFAIGLYGWLHLSRTAGSQIVPVVWKSPRLL